MTPLEIIAAVGVYMWIGFRVLDEMTDITPQAWFWTVVFWAPFVFLATVYKVGQVLIK